MLMIDYYRDILDDPVRQAAFKTAIEAAVRPGDVVVDIGCALGNFSVYACRAGAARVYAVEAARVIEVAREVVKANGCGDRVTFLRGLSTRLEVPERADVVVFEDFCTTLLSPAVARTLSDAARRWMKPGGALVPPRGRIWVAPVEDAHGHQELDRFAWTRDRVFGVDVTPSRRVAFATSHSRQLKPGALLAEPTLAGELDLARVRSAALKVEARVEVSRTAAIHGLLLWFDLELGGEWLRAGPLGPEAVWPQVLFPFSDPPLAEGGQTVELALEAGPFGEDLVWRWRVAVGETACEGNSLEGSSVRADELERWDPDRVPELEPELAIDRAVLSSVDGERTLDEIARALIERFPERLADLDAAQRRVLAVLRMGGGRPETVGGGAGR
jgi:protein arginine N-methyltransferase 1